jgi:hypothetical protein
MKTSPRSHRREPAVARWLALGGAACALLLAALAGRLSSSAWERSEARGAVMARGPARSTSVSATRPGHQERLHGNPEASGRGDLEPPRPATKLLPCDKRFDSRNGLAPRPEPGLAALARRRPSCMLAERHGRIADRPLIANCPARGPPRSA